MKKRFIYICSPLRGDEAKNMLKAVGYCRKVVQKHPEAVPIAPHIYCTNFLNDSIPEERAKGMQLGLAMLDRCDELWICTVEQSEGMKAEIAYAKEKGIPVYFRAEMFSDMEATL